MAESYVFLRKQGVGASVDPVVAVGDRVERGALLGSISSGQLGACLHTSVTGVVREITDKHICVLAEKRKSEGYVPITGTSIVELVGQAGIIGMGGAGYPTARKLDVTLRPGGTVILNAAECEPILSNNIRRIESDPEEVYIGLVYAMQAVGAEYGIIAVKSMHEKAIAMLKSVIRSDKISIHLLADTFPMGEKKAILRECLHRLIKPEDHATEAANAVVLNVETALHVFWAVDKKMPCITKDVTVAGLLNKGALQVFPNVSIGRSVGSLIEMAGGISGQYGEIIMGGPFQGCHISLHDAVTKITNGVIVTAPMWQEKKALGLLVCACGAHEERLRQLATYMGAPIAGVAYCKNTENSKRGLRCLNPGHCPGQLQAVLQLKKAGAKAVLISNCTDCTNTVMAAAPRLNMAVYHCTDHAMRACGLPLIRKIKLG